MEDVLLRVGSQAANFAIRSGLAYASKFAFVQVNKFIQGAPDEVTPELEKLRKRLENKIKVGKLRVKAELQIVTPAIDLIERIAARGNTSLTSTVQLTTTLRHDINEFGKRVSEATESQGARTKSQSLKLSQQNTAAVLESMKDLLRRIEDAVPLISLALTTSGANLSSSLPDTVSPSRLLQASALLRSADEVFGSKHDPTQVGPTFIVKYYSIFTSHARVASIKDIQWKEEYAKCRASIVRVPSRAHQEDRKHCGSSAEDGFNVTDYGYEYELRLTEDLDDGRYHEELEEWSTKKMRTVVAEKGYIEGRMRHIPVHKVARLFYEHAGILLNLGESLSPVLIAKIQHGAPHPQNVLERFINPGDESDEELGHGVASGFEIQDEEDSTDLGARMGDIEWIAFEVYQDDESDDEDDDEDDDGEITDSLVPAVSALQLESSSPLRSGILELHHQQSSLSLLEYLLRLTALQTFEQQSHMDLTDEHIVLFLRDDNPASRQPPTLEGERNHRRRSSVASLSSDFSARAPPVGQYPISPPHSDELDGPSYRRMTPVSSSPIPSEKPAEKLVKANPRSHLERAMAAEYDPMTLMTPLANRRRVTRGGPRPSSSSNIGLPKIKSGPRDAESAPGSLTRASNGQRSGETNENSPSVGRNGPVPVARAVSAASRNARV